jgi:hypothetical protein
MTRDQAKTILLLHRPWAHEPLDLEMSEALALATTDGELKAWFEQYHATQKTIHDAVHTNATPEALREQIVSECNARRRATRRKWLAASVAALLLLGVGIEAWLLFGSRSGREEVSFAAFERRMSRDALRLYRMDIETDDLQKIRDHLSASGSPAGYALPGKIKNLKATGALATRWQGHPVSMICFHTGRELPPGQSSDLFLFVIAQSALPDGPTTSQAVYGSVNRLTVAKWSENGSTYLLATEQGEDFLRKNL